MRTGFLTLLTGLWLIGTAHAQFFSDPRAVGMSGAVRGDPTANSALVANPAGMSRGYQYAAEAEYYRVGQALNIIGANIVDSKTKPNLAVGIAYAYQFTDSGTNAVDGHDARIGFAHPLVPNELSVGLSMRYLHIDRDLGDDLRGFTLDAGLIYSPSGSIHVGLVGQNLINRDDPTVPRLAGGGLSYTGELVTAVVDVVADFDSAESTKPVVSVGLETVLAESVPLRAGFERNQATEQQYVSGGMGFLGGSGGPQSSQLSLSYRQNLDVSDDFVFSAGLTLFL